MCLFFVFGVVPKEKVIGHESRYCPYCGRETSHEIVESRSWFTLFFVPLFPVGSAQTFVRCESCGSAPELFRAPTGAARTCPNCGAEVATDAKYCQSCGHRL